MHIPQVLQIGDILDNDASYDERSVIILLIFLASQLIHRKKLVRLHAYVILYDLIILCLTVTCVGTASAFQDQLRSYRLTSSDYRTPDIKPLAVSQLSISMDALHTKFKSQGENLLKFDSPLKGATLDNYDSEGFVLLFTVEIEIHLGYFLMII